MRGDFATIHTARRTRPVRINEGHCSSVRVWVRIAYENNRHGDLNDEHSSENEITIYVPCRFTLWPVVDPVRAVDGLAMRKNTKPTRHQFSQTES